MVDCNIFIQITYKLSKTSHIAIKICLEQCCPIELSQMMEMFYIYTVYYGSYSLINSFILINLSLNSYMWLVAAISGSIGQESGF